MVSVKYDELADAFDFVGFGGGLMQHEAYIDRLTGTIYWVSDDADTEVPEDVGVLEQYIAVPHKNDLDLGQRLALRFVAEALPTRYDRVEEFFHHRGAYARFKDLLESEGRLEGWYEFEAKHVQEALMRWCDENGFRVVT